VKWVQNVCVANALKMLCTTAINIPLKLIEIGVRSITQVNYVNFKNKKNLKRFYLYTRS